MSGSPSLPRDPFEAPDEGWRAVSIRLGTVRRLVTILPLAVLALGAVAALSALGRVGLAFVVLVVTLLVAGWAWWLIGRQVRAIGYLLRADDLIVVSGVMNRRLVLVPYGRMQLVDVRRGPLDRRFGLAAVQLHTAAATTDAAIPGLSPSDAIDLRDRLAALGEQRSAGL